MLSLSVHSFSITYNIRQYKFNKIWLLNILGGSVHTKNKKAVALVVASKEKGLEVNAGKWSRLEIRM
jgi:hypothetical protein